MALAQVNTQLLRADGTSTTTVAVNSPITGNGSPELPVGLDPNYHGADGISPTFSCTDVGSGTIVTISGAQGSDSFTILNGQDANSLSAGNNIDATKLAEGIIDLNGSDCYIDNNASGSIVVGSATTAYGQYSFAQGLETVSSGIFSHAEGDNTNANGNAAHSEGYYTSANGHAAHAEGNYAAAYGDYAHAEGNTTLASAVNSHAEGHYTTAVQDAAHSEGYQTLASGQYSHAEGMNTFTDDYASHAQGIYTSAVKQGSFAGGYESIAYADYSVALGSHVLASGVNQTVLGKYNDPSTTDLFQIGKGIDNDNRLNALVVDASGSTIVNTSAGLKNTRTFFDNLGNVVYTHSRQQPIYACTGTDFVIDETEGMSAVYAVMAVNMTIPNAKKVKVDGYIQIKGGIRPDKAVGSFSLDPVIETWLSAGDSAYEINAGVISNGGSLPRSVPIPFSFVTGGVDTFKLGFCSENTFQFWNGSGAYAREAGNLLINYTTTVLDN